MSNNKQPMHPIAAKEEKKCSICIYYQLYLRFYGVVPPIYIEKGEYDSVK